MTPTRHTAVRMQQRSVPPLVVDWLWQYGSWFPGSGGAEAVVFDKKARRRLEQACGRLVTKKMDELLDAYMIVAGDGAVITAGHRYKRLRRH